MELKWYHLRRARITKQYCAGIIGGFGFGVMLMAAIELHTVYPGSRMLGMIFGPLLIAIGSTWQMHLASNKAEHDGSSTS